MYTWLTAIIIVCAIAQSTWLFIDARKRDSMPWFWGIWGLIQIPMPLLLYLLFVRSGWFKRKAKENDHNGWEGENGDEYRN